MQVGQWQLAKSYGSRLIINKKHRTLWRFGMGEQGAGVRHNYRWLEKVLGVIPAPAPRQLRTLGPLVISSESYVTGRPLTPQEITSDRVDSILTHLAPMYRKWLRIEGEAGSTTLIHGDLTHRNVLVAGGALHFIDGDRSGVSFPEFDVWLLLADSLVHAKGGVSHREFIQLLMKSSPEVDPYRRATLKLYEGVPEMAGNRLLWPRLWSQFLVRCISHSRRDCLRRGKSIDWLDGLTS